MRVAIIGTGALGWRCCFSLLRWEPGTVHHLGAGRIILGEFAGNGLERVEQLAAMFRRQGLIAKQRLILKRARWEKLGWNIPFNGLAALLLQSVDRLLAVKETRKLVRELMLEVIEAGNRHHRKICRKQARIY